MPGLFTGDGDLSFWEDEPAGSSVWRKGFRILLLALALFLLSRGLFFVLPDSVAGSIHDLVTFQREANTPEGVRRALSRFDAFSYEEVKDTRPGRLAQLDLPEFEPIYRDKTFLKVVGWNRYRRVCGPHRMAAFLPGGGARVDGFPEAPRHRTLYVVLDPEILIKLLDLSQALQEQGCDPKAIRITSGFRDPSTNFFVGGASRSRHLYGDAVDILVRDVNRDAKTDSRDKALVYHLLDERVIAGHGGVGTYAHLPQVLHLDTRGQRARWRY